MSGNLKSNELGYKMNINKKRYIQRLEYLVRIGEAKKALDAHRVVSVCSDKDSQLLNILTNTLLDSVDGKTESFYTFCAGVLEGLQND